MKSTQEKVSVKSVGVEFEPLNFNQINWHSESEIPEGVEVFDLESLVKGEGIDKLKASLDKAYPFYIKNYGISEKELESVFNASRDFFNKPEEEKKRMVHARLPKILRGYSGYGTGAYENSLNNGKAINQYTKYAWGPSDNIYPDRKFEKIFNNMINKISHAADRVLDCIGDAFDLKSDEQWKNLFHGEDTVLHCQCYFPEKPLGKDRMVTHADASTITLLTQLPAKNGHVGLRAKMGDEYVGIPAIRGTIVVMTGESLNAMTNGRVQPVLHAVTGPKDDYANSERSSMPFFANPRNDFVMKCPPESTHRKFYNENSMTKFGEYSDNIAKAYAKTESAVV